MEKEDENMLIDQNDLNHRDLGQKMDEFCGSFSQSEYNEFVSILSFQISRFYVLLCYYFFLN